MKTKAGKTANSLTNKILARAAVLLLILLAILVLGYYYMLSVVEHNLLAAEEAELELCRARVENALSNITEPLAEIFVRYNEIDGFTAEDGNQVYYTSKELLEVLQSKMSYSDAADGFFVLNQTTSHVLTSFSDSISGREIYYVYEYLQHMKLPEVSALSRWTTLQINGQAYFAVYYSSDCVTVGAIISAQTLLGKVSDSVITANSCLMLADGEGAVLASAGADIAAYPADGALPVKSGSVMKKRCLTITEELPGFPASLVSVAVRENALQGVSFVQWSILLLLLFSLAVLVLLVLFLRREVLSPLAGVERATVQIRGGNLDYRLDYPSGTRELQAVRSSFNDMTAEIKNLKIQAYEDEIERQKTELKYLQLQIRPHFYLNALTTIHSMTFLNRENQIRAFIEALSNHMRYTIRSDMSLVTLGEELHHVDDYICMQQIRLEDRIFYLADVPPEAENAKIPQFLILTFVENIFKHAVAPDTVLSVMIKVQRLDTAAGPRLRITIEDNGTGFPEGLLGVLKPSAENGEHIGINNVLRTLKLICGETAEIRLANSLPNGARVEIDIPAETEENGNAPVNC